MKTYYLLITIFLYTCNFEYRLWWFYDTDDHNELFNIYQSPSERLFIEDQGKCKSVYNGLCYSVNSELKSKGTLTNKCCIIKKDNEKFCLNVFTEKYFLGNLYSLDYAFKHDMTYDCDGEGDKTFNSSDYDPIEKWEIEIKEKYDCIYSETEEQCKANPKYFKLNTRCCWFSNVKLYDKASCFGMKELIDEEFNKIIPYIGNARMLNPNKTMDFSCYDKTDKVKTGSFDLKFNYIMMSSLEEKMAYEIESENALLIFSKKQSFVGVKDYDYSDYSYGNFRIYTISPNGSIKNVFTISTKFRYKINDDRRNLQQTDRGYIQKIIPCTPENVDESSNLNITLSICQIEKENGQEIEKIEIEKGNDLIGNFENGKNEIFEGQTFMNDNDLNKVKYCANFTFKNPQPNIKKNTFKGETTEDRKNILFVLYHTENNEVQTIQATASFLKDSPSVTFTMAQSIDLKKGITIIPNQLAQNENGEYLYLQNKVGPAVDDDDSEDLDYSDDLDDSDYSDDSDDSEHEKSSKSGELSTGLLIGIISGVIIFLSFFGFLVGCLLKKKQKKIENTQNVINK